METNQIRSKYIEFFVKKGHKEIPSAPIVPPEDPTTLFTSSGMQQLVPFLKGEPHPIGKRLVDSQPCFRAEDIEEIGDNRHTTFFEMLGNWSLGDYFKAEQLPWVFEFLTKVIGLDSNKLYATVFAGDGQVKTDEESIAILQKLFKTKQPAKEGKKGFDPKIKIYTYAAKENWWSRAGVPENMPPGEIGGPDSEVFYDFGAELKIHEKSPFKDSPCHLNCECGRFLEIGNSVFIQYEKQKNTSFKPLPNKNVDFGGGLERIAAASQNTPDMFQSDLFVPVIREIEEISGKKYESENKQPMRIIADHLRAATFMLAQGVIPSNKTQGYILRRLIRRSVVKMKKLETPSTTELGKQVYHAVGKTYKGIYLEPKTKEFLQAETTLSEEIHKFEKALDRGVKVIKKHPLIDGKLAFDLLQTFGFPWELTLEMAAERGQKIDKKQFQKEFRSHQELSRKASAGMFKGGLADKSEATIKLHTTTHLLHKALREVLGDHVRQEGSHVTAERLRFDFSHPKALTDAEIQKIENLINQKIKENLPVHKTIENKDRAFKSGALAFFKETYPDQVSVYTIGKDPKRDWFSKEICGGPHVKSTGEIGAIKITKQQSIGTGLRRLYAELNLQKT
jgi:alanyl-tRNA synthetase